MNDHVLAQAAYDAYRTHHVLVDHSTPAMPHWEGLDKVTQDAWRAVVLTVFTPADQAVRGVQAWMALDVHSALRKPVQAADHQGHPAWGDWWAELLDDVRAIVERQSDPTVSTPSPLCRESATFPGGRTVTCGKSADHTNPWHRRDADSWKVLFGAPRGHRPRTTPKAG